MSVPYFRSLQQVAWAASLTVTTDAIVAAVEHLEIDQDSTVAAIDQATEELRRIREGAVLTDLIEDVPA